MKSKKARLNACKLYLILDAQVCDYKRLWAVLQSGVNNGVDIVQLRDKLGTVQKAHAFILRAERYLKGRIPFIVNDRADLACITGASGVHVGQDDLSVAAARQICGRFALIGTSCQTLAHLRRAKSEGVDYVGFGSVFKTQTKPDRSPMDLDVLRKAAEYGACVKIPVFAIGGITKKNMAFVRACGITRVAVCREILLAQDPARASRELKTLLITN
jgi:thiamine-phosphate pyrophosphorylase